MSSRVIVSGFDPAGPFAGLFLPPRFRKRQAETRFKQKWKLPVAQYVAMMNKFRRPKRQRGSIILAAAGPAALDGFVFLDPHNFVATGNAGTIQSGVSFDSDGGLREIDNQTGNVDQSGEWWSDEPSASIGDDYDVEALSAGKVGTWTNAAAADDTPIQINADRLWDVRQSSLGTKTTSATFEIQKTGTGTAEDAAIIECKADFII